MSSSYRCKFIKNIPDKQILKAFTGSSRVFLVKNRTQHLLWALTESLCSWFIPILKTVVPFVKLTLMGIAPFIVFMYVFGTSRHMRRRWTVAVSTLILRLPITCSFVFMSNLMAYNSMSNIFTPFNPIFLIPLKVKI